jgi:hypothetical protein
MRAPRADRLLHLDSPDRRRLVEPLREQVRPGSGDPPTLPRATRRRTAIVVGARMGHSSFTSAAGRCILITPARRVVVGSPTYPPHRAVARPVRSVSIARRSRSQVSIWYVGVPRGRIGAVMRESGAPVVRDMETILTSA